MKNSFLLVILHFKLFCLTLAMLQNLQSSLTKKSRKLGFIPGSKLTITPELLIPTWDIHSSQSAGPLVHSTFLMSLPFTSKYVKYYSNIPFERIVVKIPVRISEDKKLFQKTQVQSLLSTQDKYRLENRDFNKKTSLNFHKYLVDLGLLGHEFFDFMENGIPLLERNVAQPWWMKYMESKSERKRKPRNAEDTGAVDDRLVIFGKLEAILASVGLPGRECLLRTICEIHEYPHWNAYGIIGELFQTVFRVRRFPQPRSTLRDHLEAQRNGRAGNCSRYVNVCSKSLFTAN